LKFPEICLNQSNIYKNLKFFGSLKHGSAARRTAGVAHSFLQKRFQEKSYVIF